MGRGKEQKGGADEKDTGASRRKIQERNGRKRLRSTKKLQLSNESFYNNQYDRDSQLLTLIKERDSDQEAKTKE